MTNESVYQRKVIGETIASSHLGEERDVRIFLPPGFNEMTAYPVLYTQDGQDFFMYGRVATLAQQLILEEGLQPFLIVGVDVIRRNRTAEYSSIGARNQAYRKFFLEEMMPQIESRYQLPASGLQRVIAGDSLGATVSLDIALDRPELFQGVLSFSGAFWEPTNQRIQETDTFPAFDMYMLVGEQETAVNTHLGELNFLQLNRQTYRLLQDKQAFVTYMEKPGEHTWGFWQREMPDALRHFFRSGIWIS